MRTEFKGTKQPINKVAAYPDKSGIYEYLIDSGFMETKEEAEANAELFTDALNTIQQCGLMPSELMLAFPNCHKELAEYKQKLREENTILKRRIENMEHNRFERMDKDDKISGGRSLSEVCEENAKLKEVLNAAIDYIDESPCDPDITIPQSKAWEKYQRLLKELETLNK